MTRFDDSLAKQSERARALTRVARIAAPDDARRLGEMAATLLHQVVAHRGTAAHRERILNFK